MIQIHSFMKPVRNVNIVNIMSISYSYETCPVHESIQMSIPPTSSGGETLTSTIVIIVITVVVVVGWTPNPT